MNQPDQRRQSLKGGAVARIAARWCRDPVFQRWIEAHSGSRRRPGGDETPDQAEAMARALILVACGIKSRAELDHDAGAVERFDELVRRPYLAHLATEGLPARRRLDAALAERMAGWLAGVQAKRWRLTPSINDGVIHHHKCLPRDSLDRQPQRSAPHCGRLGCRPC